MGMKFCVLVIFLLLPWISRVGDWALRWTEGNENLQVFFVMLFFPVVMNATQYYIIDSFIKKRETLDHEIIPSEDDDSFVGSVDSDAGEVAAEDVKRPRTKIRTKGSGSEHREEYDPDFDGETTPTTIVGSRSSDRGAASKVDDVEEGPISTHK
jgi:hypothetical protein